MVSCQGHLKILGKAQLPRKTKMFRGQLHLLNIPQKIFGHTRKAKLLSSLVETHGRRRFFFISAIAQEYQEEHDECLEQQIEGAPQREDSG